MNRTPINSNSERAARIASATPAERETARQDYARYAKTTRTIGSAPEPFPKFLAEWLTVRQVQLPEDVGPDQYEARDYSAHYRGGE